MTDETGSSGAGQNGPQPGDDTWAELGRRLEELGSSISMAVSAAVNDPENRRHAAMLRDELSDLARRVGDAFDEATDSPGGQRFREDVSQAADKVAAAGRKVAEEVRPHLIDLTRTASESLRDAAAKMERRASEAEGADGGDAAAGDSPDQPADGPGSP